MSESCEICKSNIDDVDHVAICPHCSSMFHFIHLNEWVKRKEICPNCRTRFSWTFIEYFKSEAAQLGKVPQRYQSNSQILYNQTSNIRNFSGPLNISEIHERVESNKCIVCGEEDGFFSKFGNYTYCGYAHFERVNPKVIIVEMILSLILGLVLILSNSIHPILGVTLFIPFLIYFIFRYFYIENEGKDILLMLHDYEEDSSLFVSFIVLLIPTILTILLLVQFIKLF